MKTAIAIIALLTVGCSSGLKQVQVEGSRDDRIGMAGEWSGIMEGVKSDADGKVILNLRTGRHTAEGAIKVYEAGIESEQTMDFRSIKVDGKEVHGAFAPYRSDRCDCLVHTEFRGLVQGDVMDGTFTSRTDNGKTLRVGSWSLYRER